MNLSLKPNPIIALWVPGFLTLTVTLFVAYQNGSLNILSLSTVIPLYIIGFMVIIAGFAVGEFLDTIRGLSENIWDRICKHKYEINWKFFFDANEEHIRNLEEWYFTYYELDFNLLSGTIIIYILSWFSVIKINCTTQIIMIFPSITFLLSVLFIRKEIKELIDDYYKKNTSG